MKKPAKKTAKRANSKNETKVSTKPKLAASRTIEVYAVVNPAGEAVAHYRREFDALERVEGRFDEGDIHQWKVKKCAVDPRKIEVIEPWEC